MRRTLLFVAIAFVLLLAGGIIYSGRDETAAPPDTSITFGKGHAAGRRITTPSWSCEYDKIVANNDQTILNVDGVHNGVIYRDGKPYLHLTAQHLSVNMLTRDFFANGKLHVESIDRKSWRSFETDTLTWNESQQTLSVTSPLTFVSQSEEPMRVSSLIYDIRAGTLHIGKAEGAMKL
jgi:hypothetical protein